MSNAVKTFGNTGAAANYLRQEIYRAEKAIEEAQDRIAICNHMQEILKICRNCGGSGTVVEGRTDQDMPNYQPCRACTGKGHTR